MQWHRSVYSLLGLLSVDKTVHSVVLVTGVKGEAFLC
jgi:hypothetical protein